MRVNVQSVFGVWTILQFIDCLCPLTPLKWKKVSMRLPLFNWRVLFIHSDDNLPVHFSGPGLRYGLAHDMLAWNPKCHINPIYPWACRQLMTHGLIDSGSIDNASCFLSFCVSSHYGHETSISSSLFWEVNATTNGWWPCHSSNFEPTLPIRALKLEIWSIQHSSLHELPSQRCVTCMRCVPKVLQRTWFQSFIQDLFSSTQPRTIKCWMVCPAAWGGIIAWPFALEGSTLVSFGDRHGNAWWVYCMCLSILSFRSISEFWGRQTITIIILYILSLLLWLRVCY